MALMISGNLYSFGQGFVISEYGSLTQTNLNESVWTTRLDDPSLCFVSTARVQPQAIS